MASNLYCFTIPAMHTVSRFSTLIRLFSLLCLAVLVLAAGCVERTISLTSEPAGALVYLNDQEVGRTPLRVPFTFYGKYGVRLVHDDYQPLFTERAAKAPWWEAPGPDLLAEMIPHNKVDLAWHFEMKPAAPGDPDRLIDRARQMRAKLREEVLPLDTQAVEPGSAASPAVAVPATTDPSGK
jgi:hypothetical protein